MLLAGSKSEIPIIDIEDKKTAEEKEFTLENIIESIILSSGNRIGEYSNMATTYLNKTPKTEECKQTFRDYVDYISVLNGKEIDRVKTNYIMECPKYISKNSKPLPYFMRYSGEYYSKMKLNSFESNMNLLCWELEGWQKKLEKRKENFKWNVFLDKNIIKNEEKFEEIHDLYKKFQEMSMELHKFQYVYHFRKKKGSDYKYLCHSEIKNKEIDWDKHFNEFEKQAKQICPNQNELANYVAEICYKMYRKNSKNFAWIVAKKGLVENIKPVPVYLPIETVNGQYSYLGRDYELKEIIFES